MKGKVMEISSVSHLIMKDGVPCDKYTATIKLRVATRRAILKYYYVITRKTEFAVLRELSKYDLYQIYDFDENQLTKASIR